MIEKKEIVIGTKEEIADYFIKQCEDPIPYSKDPKSRLLYTKEGFIEQMNTMETQNKNKMGLIFYLIRKVNPIDEGIELELKSGAYRIKE